MPAGTGVTEAYVDQLIDPTIGPDDYDPVYRKLVEQPQGRRYFGAQLHHFSEDRGGQGVTSENGLLLNWRRETRNFGELEAEGALLNVSSDATRSEQPSTGTLLTFRQHDFALTNDLLMQNSVGIDRTRFDPALASSYRFKLPSTLMVGANTHLSSSAGDFRFSAGRLGRLDSGQVQTFDATDGSLISAGFSKEFTDKLQSGFQLMHINGANNVVDHESLAGVIEYRDAPAGRRYQGHILADTEGAAGLWLDGEVYSGRWRNRFGVFRLGPGLLWADAAMANDQQGFYSRMDMQTLRYQLAGGVEYSTSDIEDDPLRSGTQNITAFVTGNRRLGRLSSIGGAFNLRDSTSTDNTVAGGDSRSISLTVHGSHRFAVGTSRVQLKIADIENGPNHGNGSGVTWDQSWEISRAIMLSSTVGFEAERGTGNDETRFNTGLLAFYELSSRLRWDASVNWTRTDSDSSGISTNSVNASAALLWRFLPGWEVSLRAGVNDSREDSTGALAGTEFDNVERTVFLSVRRDMTTGRPFDRYGADTGKTGYGSVEGVVFFDENRDGIRQAGERAAAGAYIYLDRRYQRVTDRDGRFEFDPVPVGQHNISIAVEDLPLPWGLDDESPRPLSINIRERASVSIPLVRYDE